MARIAKQNIREKTLEAAERRLWHYGIKKTTIDEIAADAGVGKGTVYLYFDSKEDISLAIFEGYKHSVLQQQLAVAEDETISIIQRLRDVLLLPVLTAHRRCSECPEALELIAVLKPHLSVHLRPYLDQEIDLIAGILKQGVARGVLSVDDPLSAARSLKYMTMGFMPPYPCVSSEQSIENELDSIVRLVIRGLSRNAASAEPCGRRTN